MKGETVTREQFPMNQIPNVVVVMSRCTNNQQGFAIRFEQSATDHWTADWAFEVRGALAKREGYYQTEITGSFAFDNRYPGCPHCEAMSIFKCGCSRVACWDGKRNTVTCPWCAATSRISGELRRVDAGEDL